MSKPRPEQEILIISTSLNPGSRSHRLAKAVEASLARRGAAVRFMDLRDRELPICDGDKAYSDPAVGELSKAIRQASAVLLAAPIYNFDLGASAKNLIELTSRAWNDKLVGFLCAAGGNSSYMSPMGLAVSLMLDFRSLIIPRFVYATGADFEDNELASPKVEQRIEELAGRTVELARALATIETPPTAR